MSGLPPIPLASMTSTRLHLEILTDAESPLVRIFPSLLYLFEASEISGANLISVYNLIYPWLQEGEGYEYWTPEVRRKYDQVFVQVERAIQMGAGSTAKLQFQFICERMFKDEMERRKRESRRW